MKVGFFTMPIHPRDKDWRVSLREDREAFILADELGYCEGYVGEHVTDIEENITSSLIFLSSLVGNTRQIRLGSGTVNLPNRHPAAVACEVAMLDHMLDGRFILGVGPGGLMSDAELFGSMDNDRTEMLREAIEFIIALWSKQPPYELTGKYWNLSTARTQLPEAGLGAVPLPFQRPHPPIALTVASPFSGSALFAGQRGWGAISANFLLPKWVRSHWTKYLEGAEKSGLKPDIENWRVAKSVFVAEDEQKAREYATSKSGPYYHYYDAIRSKLARRKGGLNVFKDDPGVPDEAITPEYLCEKLVIYGSPSKVVDDLLQFRETVGAFGTLLNVGADWLDRDLSRRSMILLAEAVQPRVQEAVERSDGNTPAQSA
ncbi:MAG: LLM class flavin-dependent oxidoreductase [Rhodobiaceae bacterium]|nr:LLM class flavin-dependent oxidoreductase [Rhodobiaceae bacterium]